MDELKNFIAANRMNEGKALDMLQSRGVISDNVVHCEDVARADVQRAIAFLSRHVPGKSACQKPGPVA